jgi:Xaa-Pro aminopeptidase
VQFLARQREVVSAIEDHDLDCLLITHLPNVRYLTGFTGSSGALLLGPAFRKSIFITDGRYTAQAKEEVQSARVLIGKGSAMEIAAQQIARLKQAKIGIEAEQMAVSWRSYLRKLLPAKFKLKETSALVAQIRAVKDEEEIAAIRRAVLLGAEIFEVALKTIRPGICESDVAAEMEYAARRKGAEAMSFETIVASGPRSALPHGKASRVAIPSRGFVVLDFGVILDGYCSDMTRTVHVGRPSPEARRMYNAVLESQLAGIEAVQAGATAGGVDFACRNVLRRARLDRYFTHSTGHGVGLEIHEFPRLARNLDSPLAAGMVVTIEPGVYIAGKGGVRIEDMVVVREKGRDVLTPVSKELVVL